MSKESFKNVSHFTKASEENRGTNEKMWLLSPENELCLFKKTQIKDDNTSTNAHYAELIYYELCKLLYIDCAKVELARIGKQKGIISYFFLKDDEELVDFNALIQNIREDYIPKSLKCKKTQEYYSIDLILEAVKSVVSDRVCYKEIRQKILHLIIMDTLCDHYDRNSSNIALIRDYKKPCHKQFKFSPIYDNGTSLAISLPLEITRKYLESPNGILELNNAVISKIGLGSSRGTQYENLLNYIFNKYSDDVAELIEKIDQYVNEKTLIDILFERKYRNLDYERKKLILIKVLFNKNKIVSLYNSYNHDKSKTFTKSYN